MDLETQIEKLTAIGVALNPGVTTNDFLLSHSREEYEAAPFDLILFMYGAEIEVEPWGRYISDSAWDFDVEAIEDDGSYVEIVEQFHRITGRAKQIENLRDHVDIASGVAELRYTVEGQDKLHKPVIDNDWADADVVTSIMEDLMEPGFDYYGKDNGQSTVWFYLSAEQATALNRLANNVFDLEKKPWWKIW